MVYLWAIMEREGPPERRISLSDLLTAFRQDQEEPVKKVIEWAAREQNRARNFIATWAFMTTNMTLKEIGELCGGITKQGVEQIVKGFIRLVWERSSSQLQKNYPWEEINFRRPVSLVQTIRSSERREGEKGVLRRVVGLIEGGVEDPHELLRQADISSLRLGLARRRLARHGIEIRYIKTPYKNKKLARELQVAPGDEEISNLLHSAGIRFYLEYSRGKDALVIPLKRVASDFYYKADNTNLFADALEEEGIPVGIVERVVKSGTQAGKVQRYYFIARQHLDRAREILKGNSKLEIFKESLTRQICGPRLDPADFPTAYDIQKKKGEYESPARLLEKLGIRVRGRSPDIALSELFTGDCPTPVFRRGTNYCYRSEDEEKLREFLETQIQKLKP